LEHVLFGAGSVFVDRRVLDGGDCAGLLVQDFGDATELGLWCLRGLGVGEHVDRWRGSEAADFVDGLRVIGWG
jgi:hypothetical protein